MSEHEQDEIRRSAEEAARRVGPIVADPAKLARFANPPADTPFPLEYAHYLLHQHRAGGADFSLTILNYGCGAGEDLAPLAAGGDDVIGLDISPDLIEHAKKRAEVYNVKARFIVGSAYETTLPDKSVDVIFAIAIFHHLDLIKAREEMRRILKPGGIVIVQEPVRDSKWFNALRSLFPDRKEISEFEKPLTKEQLDMLSQGFKTDSIRRFRLPLVSVMQRISPKMIRSAYKTDARLLRVLPAMEHLATIEVRKLTLEAC